MYNLVHYEALWQRFLPHKRPHYDRSFACSAAQIGDWPHFLGFLEGGWRTGCCNAVGTKQLEPKPNGGNRGGLASCCFKELSGSLKKKLYINYM